MSNIFNQKAFNLFVENNIKESTNYNESLNEYRKICRYLSKNSYVLSPDSDIELIQNNYKLESILKIIVDYNMYLIKKSQLDMIFKDQISVSLIDSYCLLKDIEVDDENIIDVLKVNGDFYSDDNLRIYLNEISGPLLKKDEERELGYRILNGDENAKRILIERNLKLVVSVAKRYIGVSSLSFLDLIQEGNIGLMMAVDKYDVTKGCRFSTYATYWIRQSVFRAVQEKGRSIRIPCDMALKITNYTKTKNSLAIKLGREPLTEDIAKEMNVSVKTVRNYEKLSIDIVSLNSYVTNEETEELIDLISDDGESLESLYLKREMALNVRKMIEDSGLNDREKAVIINRFGIGGIRPKTLEEIGTEFGVTRERIRQMESRIIRQFANYKDIKKFIDYMDGTEELLERIEQNIPKKVKEKNSRKTNEDLKIKTEEEDLLEYLKNKEANFEFILNSKERKFIQLMYGKDYKSKKDILAISKYLGVKKEDLIEKLDMILMKIKNIMLEECSLRKKL